MNDWLMPAFVAAAILSLERMFYALAWHRPATIHWLHRTPMLRQLGAPTEVVRLFFIVFKVLQFGVFAGWWIYFTETSGPRGAVPEFALLLGASLIAFGQMLNVSVFARLGNHGVFYGCRLGYTVPWQNRFPFTWLRHPQYVGTVLSIWGLFIVLRYPAPDWWIIPVIEVGLYTLSAHVEQ